MQSTYARKRLGPISTLFAVLMIATVGASPALAGTQTVVVSGTITVTGAPASIDFGTGGPTDVKSAAFSVVVTTNNPTGYSLRANNGPLTSGANQIQQTAQTWNGTPGAGCDSTCVDKPAAQMVAGSYPTVYVEVGTRSVASSASGDTWAMTDSLTIPNVPPGTYTGSGASAGFGVFAALL